MITIKHLLTPELELFRQKMICIYNNYTISAVKAEASIVLSMIEEELSQRGIVLCVDDISHENILWQQCLN